MSEDIESNDGTAVERRNVLKSVTAGATVALGSSSASASRGEAEAAIQAEYGHRSVVEDAVAGTELVDELVREGVLEREDLPALKPTGHERLARRRGLDGVSVQTLAEDGTVRPRISIVAQADEYAVQMFLMPGGNDYAVVEAQDGSESFLLEDAAGDVQKEGCYEIKGVVCTSGITCGDLQVRAYERLYCTQFQKCIKGEDLGCKLAITVNCKDCS
jgi:hypothetical protein